MALIFYTVEQRLYWHIQKNYANIMVCSKFMLNDGYVMTVAN